jgi:hypothetical protein
MIFPSGAHDLIVFLSSGTTLSELLECLKKAAVAFRKERGQRLVVIVEDPHGSMDLDNEGTPLLPSLNRFTSALVDFHNNGLLNVIYTISDIRAEKVLRSGIFSYLLFLDFLTLLVFCCWACCFAL